MAKMVVSRRELLERWAAIEEEDEDDASSSHPVKRRRFRQLKEKWFSDAFNLLIYLPKENHIWCGYWDLMGPLLETFYNYFKDERTDSPLKLLWNRISKEMRSCAQCIHQHHQAQEMYGTEYEWSSIGPLLGVLHTLDEERISQHLQDLNARIARGEYDPTSHYGEVASVMFEVLSFPILLDDQSLQYPGVYALLFLKSRRTRSIGFRLAGHMGKLRGSTDLDPLQHLLKKCICILESESMQSSKETSRPRVQLDRIAVWLGMKALLGFLEPPAFEEGILDRYPIFLSIVLNHISDDSLEFSHAVNCLRLLFEKLGCKLWLRATLSPSVMRNTLLGQCFHTRNEKSHKEIFDLFSPFLQSLEALQDGEHEKQRRHFLYFLLHQVTVSSNFSMLMRKRACQIALLIVLRGYKMNPPCPPTECAHMWGPSLVSSLKDLTLHSSLRQPALDLIQTIIVS
ncbi:P-loop containing nucleoside triphosphate hydrolase superfamily protein [Abeliophyllum distichum]|uniref:P-loop containing nucleoside triphosphate hydrolase superfamily protein n=1 Tax=Abeliophyllum distichum TaxID=126358 RepID=A0ABD1VS14_9LAMI